jgi:Rrf2 family protein
MKLTRASTYALQAVAYMASFKKGKEDTPVASHKIAEERKIPERFLLKVLKPLVSAQILVSVKGPNGGYRLAKSPNEVTLLDIIEAVDGPIRGSAPPSPHGDQQLQRRLETVCEQVADQVRKQLARVKISELIGR